MKTPPSWDVDLVSMVQRVGEPYTKVFLLAYTNPNFKIHATLASASQPDEDREAKDSESAFIVATELLLAVITAQNALFSLKLDANIDACTQLLRDAQARALHSPSSRSKKRLPGLAHLFLRMTVRTKAKAGSKASDRSVRPTRARSESKSQKEVLWDMRIWALPCGPIHLGRLDGRMRPSPHESCRFA